MLVVGLQKDDNIIDLAKQSANVLITSEIVDVSSRDPPSNVIKVGEIKRLDFQLIRSSPDLSTGYVTKPCVFLNNLNAA